MLNDPRGSSATAQRCVGALLVITLTMLIGRAAPADEVTSKGTVLHGKVSGLSSAGITFAPEYGAGSLTIKWADIENITTDGAFQILYGEDQEADAPLQGFSDGKLQAGTQTVDVKTIETGTPLGAGGPSFADRMRASWRYWDGNFDVGLNVQQATTDTTGFLVGLQTVRTKDPTKFTLGASYRYSTEKKSGESSSVIQDQALGLIRGDYSFTPRIYGFTSGDAMYDAIQKLSIRAVPKAGLGYVFWEDNIAEDKRNYLQGEVGPSYVYERYFSSVRPRDRDYFAIAFGLLAGYYLPYGAHADWKLDYLPAVNDFTGQYLLRNAFGLTLPLIDPISAKFSLLDEYNNRPATGANHNSLYLTFGLSIVW
jgi:hypothetical protein